MQIISEEPQTLSNEERRILKRIRNKKLSIALGAIAGLAGAYLYITWDDFIEKIASGNFTGVLILASGLLLYLTIFTVILFFGFYLPSIHPFVKDLRAGTKKVIYFHPESYKAPLVECYYLHTNIRKRPMLAISREMYDVIQPGATGHFKQALYSKFIFSLSVENQVMEFNERNTIIER